MRHQMVFQNVTLSSPFCAIVEIRLVSGFQRLSSRIRNEKIRTIHILIILKNLLNIDGILPCM
jgi:hypothetical protein